MPQEVLYTTSATASGGRDGRSTTTDGAIDVKLVTPPELGGSGGDGTNPEQLFATGYAGCFLGALKLYASQQKVEVPDGARVTATVGIGPRTDKGFGLEVTIEALLPGVERGVGEDLVAGAHELCPYSHATRGNIEVRPRLAA